MKGPKNQNLSENILLSHNPNLAVEGTAALRILPFRSWRSGNSRTAIRLLASMDRFLFWRCAEIGDQTAHLSTGRL